MSSKTETHEGLTQGESLLWSRFPRDEASVALSLRQEAANCALYDLNYYATNKEIETAREIRVQGFKKISLEVKELRPPYSYIFSAIEKAIHMEECVGYGLDPDNATPKELLVAQKQRLKNFPEAVRYLCKLPLNTPDEWVLRYVKAFPRDSSHLPVTREDIAILNISEEARLGIWYWDHSHLGKLPWTSKALPRQLGEAVEPNWYTN